MGVDVGVRYLAVTSDGEVFENPKALVKTAKKLRTRQKAVSRKVKGSNNQRKASRKVACLHRKIANIRKDAIHKMTTTITKSASCIVIEDLNVKGMLSNHCRARSIADASLAEIHRQLGYKALWNGATLLEADRWYPSSKTCSGCGNVKKELLGSEYKCEACGLVIDRDANAALNLKSLAVGYTASACCPGSSGLGLTASVKLLVGQEPK